ncbi:MAG: hypothetical protein WA705_24030 [Candidatus Ozemobacteraceae bacterium]
MKKIAATLSLLVLFCCVQTAFATSMAPFKSWDVKATVRFLDFKIDPNSKAVTHVIAEIVNFNFNDEIPGIDSPAHIVPPYILERIGMINFLQKNAKQITLYNRCNEERSFVLSVLARSPNSLPKAGVTIKVIQHLGTMEYSAVLINHDFPAPFGA